MYTDVPVVDRGLQCTVRDVAPAVVTISSSTALPQPPLRHETFIDVLREWGSIWM